MIPAKSLKKIDPEDTKADMAMDKKMGIKEGSKRDVGMKLIKVKKKGKNNKAA